MHRKKCLLAHLFYLLLCSPLIEFHCWHDAWRLRFQILAPLGKYANRSLRYSGIFFELPEGPIQPTGSRFFRCAGHIVEITDLQM